MKYLEWSILEAWVVPLLWMEGGQLWRESRIRVMSKRKPLKCPFDDRPEDLQGVRYEGAQT